MADAEADATAAMVRERDPDRYLSALYAPATHRDDLLALYAFNAEISGIRDRVREALAGEMRIQWWLDVLDALPEKSGNPVADALLRAVRDRALPVVALQNHLTARIFDLYDDPFPSRNDLEGYCGETAGALLQLTAMILDPDRAPAFAALAGRAACAQGIADLLRRLPMQRARGQAFVPQDLLAAVGLSREEYLADDSAAVRAVVAMAALASEHLAAFHGGAPNLPDTLRPAFLPLALTGAYLDAIKRDPARALARPVSVSPVRRHWLLFRRASTGWR